MKKICLLIIAFIMFNSCSKTPAELTFYNIKGDFTPYIYEKAYNEIVKNNKSFNEYFLQISEITNKRYVIFGANIGAKIGVTKIRLQLIDDRTNAVVISNDIEINPDMETLQTWIRLPEKEKYKINIIANEKIIAQGKIEYQ